MKLSVLDSVVKGKRIVLVDDSIVRGTTIANLIHMLKKAGALEVHVRICSPPFLYPCYFGTDVPSNRPADRFQPYNGGDPADDRRRFSWIYENRLPGRDGGRTAFVQGMF